MVTKDEKTKKSLRYSMVDGVFTSLMTGFTQDYFTPFLLILGGGVAHVAALASVPNLISSLTQLKSADITEKLRSRSRVINIFVFLQALMLLPMAALYWFGSGTAVIFIAVVTLFTSFGSFANPAWASLMADLVANDKRGEYFGWRSKILGFVAIGSTFTAGFILHQAGRFDVALGFTALFALSFIFRIISWRYLAKMHEPEAHHKKEDYFSFYDFISRLRHSNFTRFVIFVSAMKFAVNVASPFFAVLMLKDLGFDYLTYTVITVAMTLTANLAIKRWGIHADRVGNIKVVRLTSKLIAILPLMWLINLNPVWLFFAQLLSGFAWAGFNLSTANFVYDASTPGKRTRCIAYFNVLSGVSLCLGALIGGWLALRLSSSIFTYSIMNIILISAVLRLVIAYIMPFNIKEVRDVEKIRSHQLVMSMLKFKE
jgi:MFS family permease